MKIPRLYIDTSVLGGCFDAEFATWSNRLFTDVRRGLFVPVLSEIVAIEIQNAPAAVQTLYADIVADHAEILSVSASALELAEVYQQRQILTAKFYYDNEA